MGFLFLLPLIQFSAPQRIFLTIWAINRKGWESTRDFPTSHLLLIKKGCVGGKQQRTLDVVQKAITLHKTQGPFRIKSHRNLSGSEKCNDITEAPEEKKKKLKSGTRVLF